MSFVQSGMVDELSEDALVVAHELSQSPNTKALWKNDFAAIWEDADEGEDQRESIEVYEIIGVDSCPGANQKSIHGRRLATMSLREVRDHYEPGETTVKQSVDV